MHYYAPLAARRGTQITICYHVSLVFPASGPTFVGRPGLSLRVVRELCFASRALCAREWRHTHTHTRARAQTAGRRRGQRSPAPFCLSLLLNARTLLAGWPRRSGKKGERRRSETGSERQFIVVAQGAVKQTRRRNFCSLPPPSLWPN